MKNSNFLIWLLLSLTLTACATYYQKNYLFQNEFSSGNILEAQKILKKAKKPEKKKDRLLYFLDRGVVEQMLGNYDSSNVYFEKAYIFTQDYRKNVPLDLVGMVSNPMVKPYVGEDFELVLIHYYKAINYIHLNEFDKALVEARRINVELNDIKTKYEGKRFRYKEDAFANLLMGVIYEAKGEFNNAFIAYRNAFETYESIYKEDFSVSTPLQLKKDLLRMASQNGFYDELSRYEEKFSMKYEIEPQGNGELIFFWLNGLSPVKSELSINFTVVKGQGGAVTFVNDELGFSIPYFSSSYSRQAETADFNDLKFVRMALPKYTNRPPLLLEAKLTIDSKTYDLEEVENVSRIAVISLEDRMLKEVTQAIGRVALKQAAEESLRQQNESLGAGLSIFNALTEKADTRNWQTLPNQIFYRRVSLKPGQHQVEFKATGINREEDTLRYNVNIHANKMVFNTYHSLVSRNTYFNY